MIKPRNQERMILEFLEKHAPTIPVKEALWLAREYQRVWDERLFDAECLAVLSESVIGMSGNGSLPENLKSGLRPGVALALQQLSYCHSWVTCGPLEKGMERLLDRFDKLAQENKA